MPAHKKSAADRQRTNKPTVVDIRAYRGHDIPPAPAGVLKATEKWLEAFWGSELAAATLAATDTPAVERLATLYDLRRRAYRSVAKSPLVEGSQGQEVLNPLARQMSAWDAEIRQLEDRFGLTPRSRLSLGLQLGAAKKTLEDLWAADDNSDVTETDDGAAVVLEID